MTPLEYFREKVVPDWGLSFHEVSLILGPSHSLDAADQGSIDYERTCLPAMSRIHRDLQVFTEDPSFSKRWLRYPNSAPLFAGLAPIDLLLRGDPGMTTAVAGYVRTALGYDYA